MIHKPQAEILANLLALIRPNDWRPNQTLKVFEEHREDPRPFPDIAEASVRAACDPTMRSPSGIFLPGKHWEFERRTIAPPEAPKCPDHDTEDAHHCRSCLADVAAGERHPNQVGKGKRPHKQPPPQNWRPPTTNPKPLPTPRNTPAA